MEDYSTTDMVLNSNLRPVFSVNTEYYGKYHIPYQYEKYFTNDVLGRDRKAKFYKTVLPTELFFEKGKLIPLPQIISDYNSQEYIIMYNKLVEEDNKKQQ